MKGKIIFVTGAAVGYVLGTRAGRKRYEQIKSGAISFWNSKPVQSGVDQAKEFVGDTVGDVPQQIITAGRRAVAKMIGPDDTKRHAPATRAADGSKTSASSASGGTSTTSSGARAKSTTAAAKSGSTKPSAAKSAAKKTQSDD